MLLLWNSVSNINHENTEFIYFTPREAWYKVNSIEEMHQQIAIFLRARQCLEYTIYFGVYAVFYWKADTGM